MGWLPRIQHLLLLIVVGLLALAVSADDGDGWTKIHEEGRCAMRGHCGKKSFFGSQLPCPDNGLAETPASELRDQLVGLCGEKWSTGDVCCNQDQVDALRDNFKRVESIIGSCPACKVNFFNLFCTFTCSPDQSTFLNVTKTQAASSGKDIITEIEYLVTSGYGTGFYDSCKDVKFSATNGYAMDLIGGGAKNYTQFFAYLGQERPLAGSPFQMNFPDPKESEGDGVKAMDDTPRRCNDTDEQYRCACVDCPGSCTELPEVTETKRCYVGALPCLSFAVILLYSIFLLLLVIAVSGHVAYQKQKQRNSERLRLLQDSAPSDDEDEGDVVHNAGLLDRPQKNYWLNVLLDDWFSRLGGTCARFPLITIILSVIVVGLLSLGWINFEVERDPVRLWVPPTSAAASEKAFFDENFGPFFRAEQAFLVNETGGPVMSYDTLGWWFDVEARVRRQKALDSGVVLDDVCYKPTGDACVVQSVTGYFGGMFASVDPDTWKSDLKQCVDAPVQCLPDFGQPLQKDLLFGGYNETQSVLDASALVVTWVVANHAEGTEGETKAMDFEESLKRLLISVQEEAKERGLRLSFNTEISLEQELNKSTNTDAKIVVVSYVIMFIYASLALGSSALAMKVLLNNPANALVQSKFTLGVFGILIVLMSVSASVGLFSAAGIKVTLIIAEVIPFLVLAVGVDNIFLIVHEFERVNLSHPDEEVDYRVSKALGRMGPSIMLSATTETVAFALGAAVGMPAVRNFAVYAAGAVFINALLQVTMFSAVLALNQRREESNRADCFPFLKVKRSDASHYTASGNPFLDGDEGLITKFIRTRYAPALLGKKIKVVIMAVFLGIFTAGMALMPSVELGLDQRIAIPSDSYLINYYNDLYDYFSAGPPVYFVTKEMNVTRRHAQQQLCGRFSTCDEFSLANVLEQERKRPDISYIANPPASWIDDYFTWLNPVLEDCCVEGGHVCFADRSPAWNISLYGMPEGDEFLHYLQKWIKASPGEECPLAGRAAYGDAIVIDMDKKTIPASHFRTSHTPVRSQEDFIQSYAAARRISATISEHTGAEVFPYSKFYIFFDQYATIVRLTGALLGTALGLILLITSLFLGSLRTGAVVTVTVAMIVADVIGTMAVAGVSLNAVSLVNLVICVGLGVEFCAHVARAFMFPSSHVLEQQSHAATSPATPVKNRVLFRAGGRDARAWAALVNVGASVFTGITLTKLLGVFVLAFTRSKIFEIYYFRIWLALVVFAASHALVFLPVALSLFGGSGYVDPESDGGLEEDLAARRYRALLPDDDYDSEDDI